MNVKIAIEKIDEVLSGAESRLTEIGLKTKKRTFYTDKNLAETNEFSPKVILVFGDLAFGYEGMDKDDFCNYSICCEIKSAEVSDEELNDGIELFNEEIDKLIEKLGESDSPESVIEAISRKQSDDAEIAAKEFAKEMRNVKFKLYLAMAAILVIIIAVVVFVPMLKG